MGYKRQCTSKPSKRTAFSLKIMVTLGKIYCTIALVSFILATVEGMLPTETELKYFNTSTVTAGHPQGRLEGSGEGDMSCPQLEVLRGRDGRDGEGGIPGERGEKGERGSVGRSGATGAHGQKGERGEKGNSGLVDLILPRGPQGQEGEKGESGARGVPGLPGPSGPRVECGQTYVRWGRTTCPGNQSTELVYSGRAGGSRYNSGGGATNYLCMPDNPDYLQYDSDVQGRNYIYGVEYDPIPGQPLNVNPNVDAHNVPCAVCMAVSRCSLLMIPGKTSCPVSWTTEYVGYLMSAQQNQALPTTYECVDKDPEFVSGLNAAGWDSGSGSFKHVEISCNGMACPPYVAGRELTCVVCTR